MPDLDLPIPGVTPGPEWATKNNAALNALNDVMETGRLSQEGLEDSITAAAAELNPTALSDNFVAQQVTTSGTATQQALNNKYAPNISQGLYSLTGKVYASAWPIVQPESGDSSAALNAAYDYAASVGATLVIPGLAYPIRAGLRFHSNIPVETPIHASLGHPRTQPSGATIFYSPFGATNTTPVLHVEAYNEGVIYGQSLKGIVVFGSRGFNSPDDRSDRPGVYMRRLRSELDLDLYISGFQRIGLHLVACMDGRVSGRIMTCGTDGLYPAMRLDHIGTENTNAIRFNDFHMEYCMWMLDILGPAMHLEFKGVKFEVGPSEVPGAVSNPITINTGTYRAKITFAGGCQFTYHSAEDPKYRIDPAEQAAFIKTAGTNLFVGIEGNYFTTAADYAAPLGSRWIEVVSGVVSLGKNEFDRVWADGSTGKLGILMGSLGVFNGNIVRASVRSGRADVIGMASQNIITDNQYLITGSPTAGAFYQVTGTENTFDDNNYNVSGMTAPMLSSLTLPQNVTAHKTVPRVLESGVSAVHVGWRGNLSTRQLVINNPSAQTVSTLTGGHSGQIIDIYANNGNTTFAHGSTSNSISLLSGANLTLQAGRTLRLRYDGALWREIGH